MDINVRGNLGFDELPEGYEWLVDDFDMLDEHEDYVSYLYGPDAHVDDDNEGADDTNESVLAKRSRSSSSSRGRSSSVASSTKLFHEKYMHEGKEFKHKEISMVFILK